MLSPFMSLLIFLGTALFFLLPLLVVIYAIVFARLKRQQTLSQPLVQRSLLMLGLWLAAVIAYVVAGSAHPPHDYVAAWLADVLVGCAAVTGAMIVWLRPNPVILKRLGWSLTVGGILLTAFMAFSIHMAAMAYEIGRYSDFNEASVQSDLARNPNDPAPHFNMGNIDMMRSDDKAAALEFQQAAQLEPAGNENKTQTLFLLGAMLFRTGQKAKALDVERQLATYHDGFGRKAQNYLARH